MRHFASATLIFSAGGLAGAALTLGAAAATPEPFALLERVSGHDSASPGLTTSEPAPASLEQPAREPIERPLSSREVARRARAVTVMITGSGEYGAGVVIDDHHVLTCLHVVDRMSAIEVSISEGPRRPARVVERDNGLDAAVLYVPGPALAHARLGSVSAIETGDPVYAMGAPRKMGFSLSRGIASYVGRTYSGVHYIQTDLPINGGNSGGPLLDEQGRVVGIASFILKGSQGLAFALPIDYAQRRFPSYFAQGHDSRRFDAWLAPRTSAQPASAAPASAQAAGAGPRPTAP